MRKRNANGGISIEKLAWNFNHYSLMSGLSDDRAISILIVDISLSNFVMITSFFIESFRVFCSMHYALIFLFLKKSKVNTYFPRVSID